MYLGKKKKAQFLVIVGGHEDGEEINRWRSFNLDTVLAGIKFSAKLTKYKPNYGILDIIEK